MDDTPTPFTFSDRLAWFGLVMVALLSIARAMIEHDPFPWWQSDPFVFSPPIVGLTPRWALLLHVGIVLSSIVFLIGQHLRGFGLSLITSILLLIGLGVLGYHAWIDAERVLDSSSIVAAVCVLIVASQASTLMGAQRLLGCVLLAFALMLTAIGLYEVYVTHPQTLQVYEQGRDSFLAARGWSEQSFEALAYERRLGNPEPIAWFGLTNVFSSFVAASAAGLFTLAIAIWRTHRTHASIAVIAALISTYALMLSGSKGGFGVLAIGLVLGIMCVKQRKPIINGKITLGLCGLVVLGLLARGLIGETLGERSLLFRFQYLVGGFNIWFHDPLLGCGPGLFQEQYALLKPDLSPEDVASPHSVMNFWIASLGIGGIALATILCRMLLSLNGACSADELESEAEPQTSDRDSKIALLLVVLPMLFALKMQVAVLTPGGIVPVLIGALLWGGLSLALIRSRLSIEALRPAVFIAASVLMLHSMIEVTGTLIVSAPIWALMIGIASKGPKATSHIKLSSLVSIAAMLGVTIVLLVRWSTLNAWERELHGSARGATPIAQVRSAIDALEFSSRPQLELHYISGLLRELTGRSVDESLDAIMPTLNQAEIDARFEAIERLRIAYEARPSHTPTRIALAQQQLWIASVAQGSGRDELAIELWDQSTGLFEGVDLNAGGHRWAGNIWFARVSAFPESDQHEIWLRKAEENWTRSLDLAPHDPRTAIRLMEVSLELGNETSARTWAERAIELHEQTRLDSLKGLIDDDLARARDVSRN